MRFFFRCSVRCFLCCLRLWRWTSATVRDADKQIPRQGARSLELTTTSHRATNYTTYLTYLGMHLGMWRSLRSVCQASPLLISCHVRRSLPRMTPRNCQYFGSALTMSTCTSSSLLTPVRDRPGEHLERHAANTSSIVARDISALSCDLFVIGVCCIAAVVDLCGGGGRRRTRTCPGSVSWSRRRFHRIRPGTGRWIPAACSRWSYLTKH